MSTLPSGNGSRMPSPITVLPARISPPDSSPTSASSARYVAPAASNALRKYPGPPPTSSIVAPASGAYAPSWATESRGQRGVEAVRIGLLVPELAQEAQRAAEIGRWTVLARADRRRVWR